MLFLRRVSMFLRIELDGLDDQFYQVCIFIIYYREIGK